MMIRAIASGIFAFASMTAFAGGDSAANLDLQGLKDKCVELQGNQQLKPFKAQVTCREIAYIWQKGEVTPLTLKNEREVGGAVRMKNFGVPYQAGPAAIADSSASCEILHKFKRVVPAVDVELSCDELLAIEDLSTFCTPIIDARVAEDPSIVTFEKTSEIYNTCSGLSTR